LYDVVHSSPPSQKRGANVASAKNAIVPTRAKVVISCLRRSPRSLAAPCRSPILSERTLRDLKRKRKKAGYLLSFRVRAELQRSLVRLSRVKPAPGLIVRDASRIRHLEERTWFALDLLSVSESLARDEEIRISIAQTRSILLRILLDEGIQDGLRSEVVRRQR
jgi:hypothetical protein